MLAALARISHPHRRIQTAATFRSVQEGVIGWVSNQECHILNPVRHIILVLIPQMWSLSLAKSAVNDRLKRAAAETRKCNFENVHENPAGRPPPDLAWEPGVDWFWRLAWDSGWVLWCLAIWLRLFSQTIHSLLLIVLFRIGYFLKQSTVLMIVSNIFRSWRKMNCLSHQTTTTMIDCCFGKFEINRKCLISEKICGSFNEFHICNIS